MKNASNRDALQEGLQLAIGLVWGHLNASQFKQAHELAIGCLRVWPAETRLLMMAAFAAVELALPLDAASRNALANADCAEWAELVLSRAQRVDAGEKSGTH